MAALEGDLLRAMTDYSEVYYRYVDEWDDLSVLRDRAYLAAHNGDWDTVVDAATVAIEKAPQEKEAHLLLAMALIEQDQPEQDGRILALLDEYISEHPDSTAPAFQLLGIQHTRMGRTADARLALQQSAAYYPKQAEQLTDMLDPYKVRSFLRKSREGGFILELYKSTMLGAGYWSPDLQMARMLFESGETEAGKEKVLDHFSRRRNQQQWDFVLSDIEFCYDLLGPSFWEIFPEDTYLDLEIEQTMFGSSLNVGINNRSDRTLRNASLLLALQFTDMYATDYEVMAAPRTLPAVPAREETSFGTIEVELELFGGTKTVDDIVHHLGARGGRRTSGTTGGERSGVDGATDRRGHTEEDPRAQECGRPADEQVVDDRAAGPRQHADQRRAHDRQPDLEALVDADDRVDPDRHRVEDEDRRQQRMIVSGGDTEQSGRHERDHRGPDRHGQEDRLGQRHRRTGLQERVADDAAPDPGDRGQREHAGHGHPLVDRRERAEQRAGADGEALDPERHPEGIDGHAGDVRTARPIGPDPTIRREMPRGAPDR